MVSRLKHENFVELLGYCVEGNIRVLAYEFATMGSLHDVLHGIQPVWVVPFLFNCVDHKRNHGITYFLLIFMAQLQAERESKVHNQVLHLTGCSELELLLMQHVVWSTCMRRFSLL